MKFTKSQSKMLIIGIIGLVGGAACSIVALFSPSAKVQEISFPTIPSKSSSSDLTYSNLTGLEIEASAKDAPAFCVQTPNGTDGARPQAGLNQAGVVFEAIAEAGITRFAAIYQNPSSAVIGPIRSLRMYYLQWDTPFDCTIVHAGGADDALAAVRDGGYKDLTENYSYMYRGTTGTRLWNNLFTTASYLKQMNSDRGYGGSNIKGFSRMTPSESLHNKIDTLAAEKLAITKAAKDDTSKLSSTINEINLNFGGWDIFNVNYKYNADTNSYDRSYASGEKHEVYVCPDSDLGEVNPENVCELKQLSPAVVVAMVVQEKKAWDNYHEDITTIGSGDAYVFQNGYALKGTWQKDSAADQIKFYDKDKKEIALAPGQTFMEAIPTYGSVDY